MGNCGHFRHPCLRHYQPVINLTYVIGLPNGAVHLIYVPNKDRHTKKTAKNVNNM